MVSISACHAEDPGSIPGGGVWFLRSDIAQRDTLDARGAMARVPLHRVTYAGEAEGKRKVDWHEHM